jgi:epimerase transport system membrane fusion protein
MTGNMNALSDSSWRPALAGWIIIAAFFGGFGVWSTMAPLNGAVVASGVVKVDGNRKSMQHLDGGIIKELRVREGDRVKSGDVLIVLDDTKTRAEVQILSEQYVALRATEVRLLAEQSQESELAMPSDLAFREGGAYAARVWEGQLKQFETGRTALEGQRQMVMEKINQLRSQIEGAEAQVKAYKEQNKSVHSEADSVATLVDKMLLPKPRLLQLQRTAYGLEGQIADAEAGIAKLRQAIAEQQLQVTQLTNDHVAKVSTDLREIQSRLAEVLPKRTNAEAILARMEIRSPYSGRLIGLNVFSIGGVIQRGEKILDIVPDAEGLVVEAQIAVEDISEVHPGMRADLHLTAYKQRIVPSIHGDVVQVSADRLTDPKTNGSYYLVQIRPDLGELATLPDVHLYPGMPASVIVPIGSRTAFDYLVGPLVESFRHAFRQK